MRLRIFEFAEERVVEVTLSRRNLAALLQKLDMLGSARALLSENALPGQTLVVKAEDDEDHYRGRPSPPGPMHPETEGGIDDLPSAEPKSAPECTDPDDEELPKGIERPDPGHFRHEILHQGEVWFDRFGRLHRIEEMSLDYLLNVISFLERRVVELFLVELVLELAATAVGAETTEARQPSNFDAPLDWLHVTPLVKSLSLTANKRLEDGSS